MERVQFESQQLCQQRARQAVSMASTASPPLSLWPQGNSNERLRQSRRRKVARVCVYVNLFLSAGAVRCGSVFCVYV